MMHILCSTNIYDLDIIISETIASNLALFQCDIITVAHYYRNCIKFSNPCVIIES